MHSLWSVLLSVDSARMLTHLDDSSSSALSRLKTFAHPISQQIQISMKNFTTEVRNTSNSEAVNFNVDVPRGVSYRGDRAEVDSEFRALSSRLRGSLSLSLESARPAAGKWAFSSLSLETFQTRPHRESARESAWHFLVLRWSSPVPFSFLQTAAIKSVLKSI